MGKDPDDNGGAARSRRPRRGAGIAPGSFSPASRRTRRASLDTGAPWLPPSGRFSRLGQGIRGAAVAIPGSRYCHYWPQPDLARCDRQPLAGSAIFSCQRTVAGRRTAGGSPSALRVSTSVEPLGLGTKAAWHLSAQQSLWSLARIPLNRIPNGAWAERVIRMEALTALNSGSVRVTDAPFCRAW